MAALLRAIPSLTGSSPQLRLDGLPNDPDQLFRDWLQIALARAVPEPHAATLATVDADGMPDARTLVLKDVDERGWAVAGTASSAKGSQLSLNPVAALDFWWQPLVRAVRMRGHVVPASAEDSAADLAARSAAAQAEVEPGDWILWRILPIRVEFWQGALDRKHVRIVYRRDGDAWHRTVSGGSTPRS